MASPRLLAGLIVLATALFVVGVAIERGSGEADHHDATGPGRLESAGEQSGSDEGAPTDAGPELRPLGVDAEAWPFVALAAAASLALALSVRLRPGAGRLLSLVAVAMLAFAVLDVREVVHQLDVDETGLAVHAGGAAALHLAAALVAATMASRTRRAPGPGRADTIPA